VLLIGLVLLPFWTGVLVKNFAWAVILQDNGVVNDLLQSLGVTDEPMRLLHNRFAVIVGMVHYLLPYAVFPIFAALWSIDPRLEQAASSLGAGPITTARLVIFPLMRPGIYAGGLLVFIIATGFFIAPVILGGPGDAMVANHIEYYTREVVNFGAASALAVFVTVAVSILVVIYQRLPKEGQYGVA
jgi:ABC-type spermidine/putrescine transport system permease subunit I